MIISIVNFTSSAESEVQDVIRAINRQIHEDFEAIWHMGATLRLEGRIGSTPAKQPLAEMRGDAVIYLYDGAPDVAGAIGYHDANNRGIPYGFIFTAISKKLKEPWSVTLSHEALELIGDADVNLLAMGPHPDPAENARIVFHWLEMCDAVQSETYKVDGIAVSNFVQPLYFTLDEQVGSRNDFLGGVALRSFGIKPGGYVGFFDPMKNDMDTFAADKLAAERLKAKSDLGLGRRGVRYQRVTDKKFISKLARLRSR